MGHKRFDFHGIAFSSNRETNKGQTRINGPTIFPVIPESSVALRGPSSEHESQYHQKQSPEIFPLS